MPNDKGGEAGPQPGYKRSYHQISVMLGVVVPSPIAAHQIYKSDTSYLQMLIDMEAQLQEMRQQVLAEADRGEDREGSTVPGMLQMAVPLVDITGFLAWCTATESDPLGPDARARWGAEQLRNAQKDDGGTPTVVGFHMVEQLGDVVAVGLSLATGWNGRNPIPLHEEIPSSGYSLIQTDIVGCPIWICVDMASVVHQLVRVHLGGWAKNRGLVRDGLDTPPSPPPGWERWKADGLDVCWPRR